MTNALSFPNDDNGDVLRRMFESGDDLSKPREIDFTVVLPNETTAYEFGRQFQELGYHVTFKKADTVPALPWDVVVVKYMLPSHDGITCFEQELENVAAPLGGRNDGWGCFQQ